MNTGAFQHLVSGTGDPLPFLLDDTTAEIPPTGTFRYRTPPPVDDPIRVLPFVLKGISARLRVFYW